MEAAKDLEFAFQKETWTPELDNQLRELFAAGLDDNAIALELGDSLEAVRHRRIRLELFRYRPPASANNWTDERVSKLRRMWDEGWSASEIGAEIGFTRNAVLGKAHRLNLPDRKLGRQPGERTIKARRPKSSGRRINTKRASLRLVVDNTPDDDDTPVEQRKTLMELTADTCRWPVGDPREPDFFFCGASSGGFTYCPKHHHRSVNNTHSSEVVASRVVEKLEAQRRDNARKA